MLTDLHVKNLALIDEADIAFSSGLNVLSGETGAGKSIILGALSLALGGKVSKESLRDADGEALIEAVFYVDKEEQKKALSDIGIEPDDEGTLILSRKIQKERSVARINGETQPAARLKEAGEILLDICGQNEHQSLRKKNAQLALLDGYAGAELAEKKKELSAAYERYIKVKKELSEADTDAAQRRRELDFLAHEVAEIEEARLTAGEDETLESDYRRLSHDKRIGEALGEAYRQTGEGDSAAECIGRAIRELQSVEEYDPAIVELRAMLSDAESIINDFNRELSDYQSRSEDNGARFSETEARLDLINSLKSKYGQTIGDILSECDRKKERIDRLNDYDSYLSGLKKEEDEAESALKTLSEEVSAMRQTAAAALCGEVKKSLEELNFLDVRFDMSFFRRDTYGADGYDEAEFMISVNPGSPMLPLRDVASGGELSRVMLAIKCALSDKDAIDTLIFDEIDAGISGRTAQSVSEKLSGLSREDQVICITHLPQIASMADHHFLIEKSVTGGETISSIHELKDEESVGELARMLGGAMITDAVLLNAREMKELAAKLKNTDR